MNNIKSRVSDYFSDTLNKYRFITLFIFVMVVVILSWQSDDSYHAYAMAKNLVDGNGFVYNIGERATASSCPLFTLVIALGYFFFRHMFLVSIFICVLFSAIAYSIVVHSFCKDKIQVFAALFTLICSSSFMSYTTSGLENSMLFFLAALFLKEYFKTETYNAKQMLYLAFLISFIAMTRMDAVLMFIPMILYVYLLRRENVSFIKAVGLGMTGLSPFIIWELFSLFYYGFLVPNTAFVKLGTNIPKREYIVRGCQYVFNTMICDPVVLFIPFTAVLILMLSKKMRYITLSLGVLLYGIYVIYIGGDFMMGRHFTVMFLMSVIGCIYFVNEELSDEKTKAVNYRSIVCRCISAVILCSVVYSISTNVISTQFKFGENFNSPISDERQTYFKWTSLFNNSLAFKENGRMCITGAWNDQGVIELIDSDLNSGILRMVPGITKYDHNDMYLNDLYALGDPYLSKLPAVREPGWRIGHMYREAPEGYYETIMFGENQIKNKSASEYYEVIKLITRGDLFDKERIKAIIDINLGKYDYLIDEYQSTLDENNMQISEFSE